MRQLSGWQRLWLLISVLLVFPAILLSMILWPYRDSDIVRDLADPDCQVWREIPEGFFPEHYTSGDEPCRALQAFLFLNEQHLRSINDYDRYLANAKVKAVGWGILSWFGTVLILYIAGWSVGWVIRGFKLKAG